MKKTLILSILTILFISCQSNSDYKESGKFYKGLDNDRNVYLTFINDTIIAINSDSLKTCAWDFIEFKSNENGLYKMNELKTDTLWFKPKDQKIEMISTDGNLIFEKFELPKAEIDKINKDIEISRNFSNKGIVYDCDYTTKEVGYFYERAIDEVKSKLKNPSSAKFNGAYIHKSFTEDNKYENTTTLVSVDVEAKNGFGNFTENKYYVFFFPRADDKTKYDIVFSNTSVLDYDIQKKLKLK